MPDGDNPTGLLNRYGFTVLLGALVLFLIAVPVISSLEDHTSEHSRRLDLEVGFSALLVVTIAVTARRSWSRLLAGALCASALAAQAWHIWSGSEASRLLEYMFSAAFVLLTIVFLVAHVLRVRNVTMNVIHASFCAYLLLGILYAVLYSMVELVAPGSIRTDAGQDHELGLLARGPDGSVLALYFSFITLTTVGYGDIVPVSLQARMLAATQGLIGQLFVLVLVARLVGLNVAQLSAQNKRLPQDSHRQSEIGVGIGTGPDASKGNRGQP